MLNYAPSESVNGSRRNGAATGELQSRLALLLAEAEQLVQRLPPAELAALPNATSLPNLARALHPAATATWTPLHDLFAHAPDPVFITDRHDNIVTVNPAACAALGVDPDQLMGRSSVNYIVDRPEITRIWEAIHVAPSASGEVRVRRGDDEIRWFQVVCLAGVLPDDNLLWLWHDVTKRHRTEESLREANMASFHEKPLPPPADRPEPLPHLPPAGVQPEIPREEIDYRTNV